MNKTEFMNKLNESLSGYGINDTREILLDFEQHFEDGAKAGLTEEQVYEKLGDPVEIAKQYMSENEESYTEKKTEASTQQSAFDTNNYSQMPPPVQPVQNTGFQPDVGKIVCILLVDILIFTWALPTLFSLVFSLYGVTLAIGGSGIAVSIAGLLMGIVDTSSWLFTTFSPISTALFGVMLMAACPLLVIASIAATKGCINIGKHIVNWHSRAFVGRNVCVIKGKENV